MNETKFPAGWDAERVKRLVSYYEDQSEDTQVAEDEEAAREQARRAVISVPEELLPKIQQLLAAHPQA